MLDGDRRWWHALPPRRRGSTPDPASWSARIFLLLALHATVYAPDMLGAGFSERAPGIEQSMRAVARRVLQFVGKLGLSSFDLLGTSHGGGVAMMAAESCTNGSQSNLKLRRLVLVAPVNPFS